METIGNLIDKLTIANIRIWMAEDIKRDPNTSDKQIADATRVTNVVNSYRTDLIQEIDETINEMVATGKQQKLYKQGSTKMYGKNK
jgi:predicted lactoylglutathione lyase